jgi:hypothetical protein
LAVGQGSPFSGEHLQLPEPAVSITSQRAAFFALAERDHRDGKAAALAEAARQGPVPRRAEALLLRASLQ